MADDGWRSLSIRERLYDRLEAYALDKRSRPGTEANRITEQYLDGDLHSEEAIVAGEADAAVLARLETLLERAFAPAEAERALDRLREEVDA